MKTLDSLYYLLGLCALGSAGFAAESQKPLVAGNNPFTEDFGKRVEELLEVWHVPGLSIGIVDGDDTWTEGYGIATFPDTPVKPETLFYGASTTKAFVAATLALMIESGNYTSLSFPAEPLGWSTPIADIIRDDFALMDEWATSHLTLEDALSHRTGMPRHDKSLSRSYDGVHTATPRDVVRSLRYLPLTAPPRTKFQYCNMMYAVASHVIETLTGGQWLGSLLKQWIWEPLGMEGTYFSLGDGLAAPEHFAAGYYWDERNESFARVDYMPLEEVTGAGSTISSARDYTKWLRCLIDEAAPLPKAAHKAFKSPRIFTATTDDGGAFDMPLAYAFGWMTSSYKGHQVWTHSGGMHAYGAEVYFLPDQKFGIVTFGNTALSSNALGEILIWDLIDKKLGIPEDERFNWTAKWKDMEKIVRDNMDHAVEKFYPNRPDPGLPRALPLDDYIGTYFHPGYLNVTLESASDAATADEPNIELVASRDNATWRDFLRFEHISGEYWMVYADMFGGTATFTKWFAPAQFKIGVDGKVKSLGIEFRDLTGEEVDGLIWFDKIV